MDFRSNALNRWRATWTLSSMAVIGFGFNNQSWIVYIYSIFSRQDLHNFWWRVPLIIGVICYIALSALLVAIFVYFYTILIQPRTLLYIPII